MERFPGNTEGAVNHSSKARSPEQATDQVFKLTQHLRKLEECLATLDKQIYEAEDIYLGETPYGNVLKGWESILDSKAPTQKRKVEDKDRLFSFSCWSKYSKYLEKKAKTAQEDAPSLMAMKRSSSASSLSGAASKKVVKNKKRQNEATDKDPPLSSSGGTGGIATSRKRPRLKKENSRQSFTIVENLEDLSY